MTGAFLLPHFPCETCRTQSCKPPTYGRDWQLRFVLLQHEAIHWCPVAWGSRTGRKNISRFREVFFRHLLLGHAKTAVPERCAKRVKDLTDRIVRAYVYPMACGGFSDVWKCLLRYKHSPPERVAVKAIRPVASNEELRLKRKAVDRELNVWAGLSHQNVLPLYGTTDGFGPLPAFVCPWAENGTLSEYLEKFETQLDLTKRMMLLGDIATGLQYLHSCNIVHGDLSGSNILINNNGRACLSDFGLSTLFEHVSDTMSSGICFPGNIRWAAPELFDECEEGKLPSQLSSQQADVYSFGSIMLQILSGRLPFHRIQRVAQIVIMVSRGHRPPREAGWDGNAIPDVLWQFVEACWAVPSDRPSSLEIVSFIQCQLSRL